MRRTLLKLSGALLLAMCSTSTVAQIAEVSSVNWPRTAGTDYRYYPYLVFLRNTSAQHIELDTSSYIEMTDGVQSYARAHLATDFTLPPNAVTKVEFNTTDFSAVPIGRYNTVAHLAGPNFSQVLPFFNNPVSVVAGKSSSIRAGGALLGWGTSHVILPPSDGFELQISGSTADQLCTLTLQQAPDTSASGEDCSVFLCDIDADGDADCFVGGNGRTVTFYRNTGTPSAPEWEEPVVDYLPYPLGLVGRFSFGDIDADGDYDLCFGDDYGRLWFYRNTGTQASAQWSPVKYAGPILEAGNQVSPVLVDVDSDGDLDLVVGSADGRVRLLENSGSKNAPNWQKPVSLLQLDQGDAVPAACDVDSDGDLDILLGSDDGRVRILENTGTAQAASWDVRTQPVGGISVTGTSAPFVGDIDSDGTPEMFVGSRSGVVLYHLTDGAYAPGDCSLVYVRPAQRPPCYALAPVQSSLVTDPSIMFAGIETTNQFNAGLMVNLLPGMLQEVAYNNYATASQVIRLPSGEISLGVSAGVGFSLWTLFTSDCSLAIRSIDLSAPLIRGVASEVSVDIQNYHEYSLYPRSLSPDSELAPGLQFIRDGVDISHRFKVLPQALPEVIERGRSYRLTFLVTPSGDMDCGPVAIDPDIHVVPEAYRNSSSPQISSRSTGSNQWPAPKVLLTEVVPNPQPLIRPTSQTVGVGFPGDSRIGF